MLKRLFIVIFSFYILSSFAQTNEINRVSVKGVIRDTDGNPVSYSHILVKSRNEGWVGDYYGQFRIEVFPGDTVLVSAISFHQNKILIPDPPLLIKDDFITVVMQKDTVNLKELIVHPWPATLPQLKREFMEVEVVDPIADLDLHLPSPEEMRMLSYSLEGGFGLKLPIISMIYNKYSKEALLKKNYADAMKSEKAYSRYNKNVVSRITGLRNEDEIAKFMEFCSLQINFIHESTDYELYAAILDCYGDYCLAYPADTIIGE